VITESPALLARERQVFAQYTESLAALLAEESGVDPDDVEPHVVASALLGVHRSLIEYVRRRVAAGAGVPELGPELRRHGERALALLERGLAEYGIER